MYFNEDIHCLCILLGLYHIHIVLQLCAFQVFVVNETANSTSFALSSYKIYNIPSSLPPPMHCLEYGFPATVLCKVGLHASSICETMVWKSENLYIFTINLVNNST